MLLHCDGAWIVAIRVRTHAHSSGSDEPVNRCASGRFSPDVHASQGCDSRA
jgi:hypothetical protein